MDIAQQSSKDGCLVKSGHCLSTAAAIRSGTPQKSAFQCIALPAICTLCLFNVLIKFVLHNIQFLTQWELANENRPCNNTCLYLKLYCGELMNNCLSWVIL